MTPRDYWSSGSGRGHITPAGLTLPEGLAFRAALKDLVGADRILDFGCGIGRLALAFDPARYLGLDICPSALEEARAKNPEHRFALLEGDAANLPEADVTLAHTVLLHIPDENLPAFVRRCSSPRVIVSEILGRHWRRDGDPPVFNRELEEYEAAFADGYRIGQVLRFPYTRYEATDLTVMEFVRRGCLRDASGAAG